MSESYPWENETNLEEVKKLVTDHLIKRENSFAEVVKNLMPLYANKEFISLMVSSEVRAQVNFSQKPSHKEVNRLVNALRVQIEILKEEDGEN